MHFLPLMEPIDLQVQKGVPWVKREDSQIQEEVHAPGEMELASASIRRLGTASSSSPISPSNDHRMRNPGLGPAEAVSLKKGDETFALLSPGPLELLFCGPPTPPRGDSYLMSESYSSSCHCELCCDSLADSFTTNILKAPGSGASTCKTSQGMGGRG